MVRVALTAAVVWLLAACSQQVGDVGEAARAREVNREVLDALGYGSDQTEVRGVGCRYEDCVTVRSTVVVQTTDVTQACLHVLRVWSDLNVEVTVSEQLDNGCRLLGRHDGHELGASVQERDSGVSVSVRTTALGGGP